MLELFLREYWLTVIGIDSCIIAISPFWVDVPTSSQRVRFGTQTARAEADEEVELAEVL